MEQRASAEQARDPEADRRDATYAQVTIVVACTSFLTLTLLYVSASVLLRE
jgi:hypothetical protein